MVIIPTRTMFLDGKRVERGVATEVSQSAGELALRHAWAVEGEAVKAAPAKKAAKAATVGAE